jgi:hypothetical protein
MPSPVLMKALVVVRNTCPQPPVASSGRFGLDHQRLAGLDLQHQGAEDRALVVLDQVDGEVLVEEVRAGAHVLLIERVQDGVAGAVRRGAGAHGLVAAEVLALAAEGALVDLAVVEPREGHAGVLQLVDGRDRLAAHVLDGVLVAEIVRALDGIEHVPVPVVRQHVGQRGVDAALRGNGVRAGREDLGDDRHAQVGAGQLQRRVQAGAAGTDDQGVEFSVWDGHRVLAMADQATLGNDDRLHGPESGGNQGERHQGEHASDAQGDGLHVVHEHVAETDPGVGQQHRDEQQQPEGHPGRRCPGHQRGMIRGDGASETAAPDRVANRAR